MFEEIICKELQIFQYSILRRLYYVIQPIYIFSDELRRIDLMRTDALRAVKIQC